jgi:chitosanase
MKQADIEKAMAIVSIFETGKPRRNYAALAVLNDGAGISYGIKQFTHRSGSLLQVVEKYLGTDATAGRDTIESRLPLLRRSTKFAIDTLAGDERFKLALKDAANTAEMRAAQNAIAHDRYLRKAIDECRAFGLTLPLSMAVVYDSIVHGSLRSLAEHLGPVRDEKAWIKAYVQHRHAWLKGTPRLRSTSYRTTFFLKEIARDNWHLKLPMYVHGYLLKTSDFPEGTSVGSPTVREGAVSAIAGQTPGGALTNLRATDTTAPQAPATTPPDIPPGPDPKSRDAQVAAPTIMETVDALEVRVNAVAARVDQAERIIVTTTTRSDKAKSLWATVAGTLWQMLWAVIGFFAGVPREVWLVVAIIAGVFVTLFIYRQITLGRLREARGSEFKL